MRGDFDVINIHYVSPLYLNLMSDFRTRSSNIISSIWGSELLRANIQELKSLGQTLRGSTLVTTNNPQVRARLIENFPEIEAKIRVIPFGMRSPEVIKSLQQCESPRQSREKLGIPAERVTLACGYNASQAQQHSTICRGLSMLPRELKEKVLVLLPMTYPDDVAYRDQVACEFRAAEIDIRIFDKKLSLEDICRLRIATDCAINMQTTDSLSASIQEHLICGSVLIAGSWLPYEVFERMGAKVIRVSSEDGISSAIQAYLKTPGDFQQTVTLRQRMYEFSCWENSARRWIDLFRGQFESMEQTVPMRNVG